MNMIAGITIVSLSLALVRSFSINHQLRLKKSAFILGMELKFLELLENAPGAILIIDELGNIDSINRRAECMFGYERGELKGTPVELLPIPVPTVCNAEEGK